MNAPRKTSWFELRIPPAVLVALTAVLMWLVANLAPTVQLGDGLRRNLYRVLTLGGAALVIVGVVTFRRARTTVHPSRPQDASSLVDHGIYRFSRNPMYLGMLALLLGWAVFLRSGWSLLLVVAFVAWMNRFQITAEERILKNQFGKSYEHYCSRVRRWL